jgi:4-hydroxybenzoate polyprenyltransferase
MNFNVILAWVGGFAFFAFLTTLLREIIKDIEDFEGDAAYGRKTLPIVLGIRASKAVVVVLVLLTIVALAVVFVRHLRFSPTGSLDLLSLTWFAAALVIPFLVLIYRILRAGTREDYRSCSNLTKTIMLAGILYSFIVYYIIQQNLA